jgi:dipeptidase E
VQPTILLISSSAVHGYGYLECNKDAIEALMKGISTPLLFVPYAAARSEWDNYTDKVRTFFTTLGIAVTGIHTVPHEKVLTDYQAIFVGGGNTFRLLQELQQQGLLPGIRNAVLSGKLKYMGSSAGTNLATRSICTTNDMPIVYPTGGFDALNLFTYQINPHYIDPDPATSHKGETRDQRLAEFHQQHDTPVIGLREGAYINIDTNFASNHELYIGGINGAKIFLKGKEPYEAPLNKKFVLE